MTWIQPINEPLRALIYGKAGVGKSVLANGFPSPILLEVEKCGTHVRTPRACKRPLNFAELIAGIRRVQTEKHEFKTLVFDSITSCEALIVAAVCEEGKKKQLADFDYGKGYAAVVDKWREILAALEQLQQKRDMSVILVGHAEEKKIENPEGKNYGATILSLQERASGLLRNWSDTVLYLTWETTTQGTGETAKLVSTGNRMIRTRENGAWQAKNRNNLPSKILIPEDRTGAKSAQILLQAMDAGLLEDAALRKKCTETGATEADINAAKDHADLMRLFVKLVKEKK